MKAIIFLGVFLGILLCCAPPAISPITVQSPAAVVEPITLTLSEVLLADTWSYDLYFLMQDHPQLREQAQQYVDGSLFPQPELQEALKGAEVDAETFDIHEPRRRAWLELILTQTLEIKHEGK